MIKNKIAIYGLVGAILGFLTLSGLIVAWNGSIITPNEANLDKKIKGVHTSEEVIIFEDSDEFQEGFMDNVTLNDEYYLTLDQDLTLNNWKDITSPGPSARSGFQMVLNIRKHSIVLFGGNNGTSYFDDTWIFNLTTQAWIQMYPSTPPSPRTAHSMVYNSKSDKVILFGGNNVTNRFNETWVYDLQSNSWIEMNPTSAPIARDFPSMVYDSNYNKTILFGGNAGSTPYLSDTWIYDLSTNSWIQMFPRNAPIGRTSHSMVYNSKSNSVVLFGGTSGVRQGDTWIYDVPSNNWTQMTPLSNPAARVRHSMVYHSNSDKVILFGGSTSASSHRSDTWMYDFSFNTWTQLNSLTKPFPRSYHSMVYDNDSNRSILFGGFNGSYLADTWIYPIFPTSPFTGKFESKLFSIDSISSIFGNISWNPIDQPDSTVLSIQVGFSNSTNYEDLVFSELFTSDFSFGNITKYFAYRVIFFSEISPEISPQLEWIRISYSLDLPSITATIPTTTTPTSTTPTTNIIPNLSLYPNFLQILFFLCLSAVFIQKYRKI
ncbi:MAG: Kelch repeat-containing protein [Candidatus Kariarchaeaceae archaeon]|jgi:hypothetical protein